MFLCRRELWKKKPPVCTCDRSEAYVKRSLKVTVLTICYLLYPNPHNPAQLCSTKSQVPALLSSFLSDHTSPHFFVLQLHWSFSFSQKFQTLPTMRLLTICALCLELSSPPLINSLASFKPQLGLHSFWEAPLTDYLLLLCVSSQQCETSPFGCLAQLFVSLLPLSSILSIFTHCCTSTTQNSAWHMNEQYVYMNVWLWIIY